MEPTRFVILMPWGRVGSNLIADILEQDGAKLANEPLHALPTAAAQMRWYREFYELGAPDPSAKLIGSKLGVLAMRNAAAFARAFEADRLAIIRMRRDNWVKAAVSQIRAKQYADRTAAETGQAQWGLRPGAAALGPTEIDPGLLLDRIAKMRRAHRRLMALFPPERVLDIEYEQLQANLPGVVRDVRRQLGADKDAPYTVAFEKATPDDLRVAITNYAEVEQLVKRAGYGEMLT